jgi:hypothetical protein
MAAALRKGRKPRLGTRFGLHVTELTLACHYATHPSGAALGYGKGTYHVTTDFEDLEPMPWAI